MHTFIDSLLQSQHQFMQAMADHRDQWSETMSSMAHSYLDTSIDRLKRFHDHVANDASGLKSDMLEATLKAAIDQHQHLKDRLTVHQHHANSHKETLRRLAMGVMATFGVMSGVKAADAFESGQGNGGANSSTSTTQKATAGKSSIESGSQGSMKDLKAFFELGSSAQSYATIHSTPPKATTPTKPVMITPQAFSKKQDEQVTPPKATALPKAVEAMPQPTEVAITQQTPTSLLELEKSVKELTKQGTPEANHKVVDIILAYGNTRKIDASYMNFAKGAILQLGEAFYGSLAHLCDVYAHPKRKPSANEVLQAASYLLELGPIYQSAALEKYTRLANDSDLKVKSFEIKVAVNQLISQGGPEHKKVAADLLIFDVSQNNSRNNPNYDLAAKMFAGELSKYSESAFRKLGDSFKEFTRTIQQATTQATPPKATALPKAVEAMPQPTEATPAIKLLEIADALLNSPDDSPEQGFKILQDLAQSETAEPAILRAVAVKIMIFHVKLATLTEQKSALEMASKLTDRIKAHPSANIDDKKMAEKAAAAIDQLISKLSSTSVAQGIPDVAIEVPDVQHASFEDAMNAAIGFINLGPDNYPRAFQLLINSAIDYGGQPEHKIRAAEEIIKLHVKYQTEGKNDELTLEAAMKLLDTVVRDKSSKPEAILDVLKLLREFESPVFNIKLEDIDYAGTKLLAYFRLSNFKNPAYTRLAAEGVMELSSDNHSQAVDFYLISVAPDRNPTSNDIKLAAEEVQKFGAEYNDEKAHLWHSYGLHKDALPKDIITAADNLKSLGKDYHGKAAELFVKAANHPDVKKDEMNNALVLLGDLGPNYYAQADKLRDLVKQKEAAKSEGIFNRIEPKKITKQTKRSVQFAFPEISSVHDEVDDQTPEDASTTAPKKVMNPFKKETTKSESEKKFALTERLKTRTSP